MEKMEKRVYRTEKQVSIDHVMIHHINADGRHPFFPHFYLYCVGFGESFETNISLQRSASTQPIKSKVKESQICCRTSVSAQVGKEIVAFSTLFYLFLFLCFEQHAPTLPYVVFTVYDWAGRLNAG